MITIGENIHIISKSVREALEKKDENFIKNLIKIQQNLDCIDLNVGPAKGQLDKIYEWLVLLCKEQNISFDSTNISAIENGLSLVKNAENCFINSTSKDKEKLEKLTDVALQYNCNLIALSMSKETGIPKTADERLEIIFEIYEKCMEKGIESNKLFFDPLVLPLKADQTQAMEAINTIRMVKESFEPKVNTIIGLSNISNGIPNNLRSLVNRVYLSLCYGAGLDAVIMDAKDSELYRIIKMLDNYSPENKLDELYIKLSDSIKNFEELDEIKFDKNNLEAQNIIKTAAVLLNKKIYSDSFTQV
ncbi:dihydropteroate synthase [bacterium]|nr:dihydropteroate synthase [bacterium]